MNQGHSIDSPDWQPMG